MLKLGLSINRQKAIMGGVEAEYNAVISHASSEGYTAPSSDHQVLQNQLVADLKSNGIWDKLDAFYSLAGSGDMDFSLINWKSPGTYTKTINSAPVKSNDGVAFDGIDDYIDLGFIPGTDGGNWDLEEGSIGMVHFASPSINVYNGTTRALYRLYDTGSWTIFNINNTYDVFTTGVTSLLGKHLHADQDSSVGTLKTYHSGVEVHSTNKSANVKPNLTFSLGANHSGSSTYANYKDGSISLLYFGGSLRAEVATLSTLIETYIAAL